MGAELHTRTCCEQFEFRRIKKKLTWSWIHKLEPCQESNDSLRLLGIGL